MKLLIVSAAPFIFKDEKCFAYSPYVKELVIWEKYANEISFCCPVWKNQNGLLVEEITFDIKKHFKLIDFNLNNFTNLVKAFFYAFWNSIIIFKAMQQADHIHLRCPGNIGLLGCIIQILFPKKPKTAKYAGNWDPKAKQPWSYRLQKWILSNTFLTKNMQVLVYGEWDGSKKNIKPFFTATYSEVDKEPLKELDLKETIHFVFVGALVPGKNPLYAIQLVEGLYRKGYDVSLDLFGEGMERKILEKYIASNRLDNFIKLNGNHNQETLKKAYQESHFVLLASKSEGWPKALAEGMFWGCVPVATPVSCVPYMLDYGERGLLLRVNLEQDIQQLEALFTNESDFKSKREKASNWSRHYTLDVFEGEIKKILK
ncbi:glycosyltransferase [Flavobacterium sp. IMCC34518]|uniref:glycosyltransferase n=1 Tax=Flavobacterium sp. IMCC34518 TaxID=3003623 RepID=UPI0024822627|nr:glycosyltransferase [Flavobacterium sp. IMCC34518]